MLERVAQRFVRAESAPGERKTFLDVGCGMGAYLVAAQRLGFDVLGFEPSANHARVAINHLKLPFIADYFTPPRANGRRFDLFMLSHVIKHIYSPREFIHELLSVLKPGGALIVVTPNADSLVARVTGRLWPMLKPIDHVSMICRRAYAYFGLDGIAQVTHWSSEHPYEFAAATGAALKSRLGVGYTGAANTHTTAPAAAPVLGQLSLKSRLLKLGLTAVSSPAWAIASLTDRRACLNSVIVPRRRTGAAI